MPSVEVSTQIAAPIEKVWEFVDKPENELLWQSNATERVVLTEGPIEKGTRIQLVDRFLGKRMDSVWEVAEHYPYHRIDRVVEGSLQLESSWRLEPIESGTLFSMEIDAPEGFGGMFGKLAEPVLVAMARREFDTNLAKLKDLIEADL